MNPILRVLRMATETDRRYWLVIFLAIVDFCCVLLATERYDKGDILIGTYWLIAGILLSLLGWKWPQIIAKCRKRKTVVVQAKRALPEHRPNVIPNDYGKNIEQNAFGLFVRNPGYDALDAHIPNVPVGRSAYHLVFPETVPLLCERDHIVFFHAHLEDHTSGLPGLDGSRLHDVMRQSDVEAIKFPILYKSVAQFEYQTNCIIECVNWKGNGLTVKTTGQEAAS
jgi:hypothetical protein